MKAGFRQDHTQAPERQNVFANVSTPFRSQVRSCYGEHGLEHPALPEAVGRPPTTGRLERLPGQLLPTKGEPEPELPLVRLRARIGHQCRVIAALAAADRDTDSAEAALRHLERSLTRLQAGTMVATG